MHDFFHLKENNTTVRTEISAGVATFMTMAYIIALNPNLLTGFGAEGQGLWNAVFLATCISAASGTLLMGLLSNKPFAMAPGMGLNTYFAAVAASLAALTGMSYLESFRTVLVIILFEGLLFTVLSILDAREKIVNAIPFAVRTSIGPALGTMLIHIGFGSNAGIFNSDGNSFYMMQDFFGALGADFARSKMGDAWPAMVLTVITVFIGMALIFYLNRRHIHGAVLLGMLGASVIYWSCEYFFLHIDPFDSLHNVSFIPPFRDMAENTLFKYDFNGLLNIGWLTAVTLIISFCIIDMFDTLGTLVGTATKADMMDKNGNMPGMKGALLSDAIGTVIGSATGTSTVTTFVESAAGVAIGGRTGLTSITTAALFMLCIFVAPLAAVIPPAATSAALIYVGISMVSTLKKLDFENPSELVPAAIMLIAMPVSGSIGHAIGLGLITYSAVMVMSGKAKEVPVFTWILCVLFIIKFFFVG